jgi:hypothetical protein
MRALAVAFCALVALWNAAAGSPAWAAGPAQLDAAANGVCSYVAVAYNRGQQDKLWGYPDPVDIAGDGTLRHVYIIEQGTAHVSSIIASTKALSPAEQEAASSSEVNFYGSIGKDMELETVPRIFRLLGAYYVVYEEDGGPSDVVKPDGGEICRFKRHFSKVLAEDHAPSLCKAVRAGKSFKKLAARKLANEIVVDDAQTLDLPGPHSPTIARYSDIKLDPAGAQVRVGHFKYQSSAGAGCTAGGVVFLHGQGIEKSPRNDALLAAQQAMTNCRDSTASLIHAGRQNLIEIDGGAAVQRTEPPRLLVRLRGSRIETVCRVEQRVTYTPEPEPTNKSP